MNREYSIRVSKTSKHLQVTCSETLQITSKRQLITTVLQLIQHEILAYLIAVSKTSKQLQVTCSETLQITS
jgi:hypothetical protein